MKDLVTGLSKNYKCNCIDYKLINKYVYKLNDDYIYLIADITLKDNQLIRNYFFINYYKSINDFLDIKFTFSNNPKVFLIKMSDYPNLKFREIVDDIKSKHIDHDFCLNKHELSL